MNRTEKKIVNEKTSSKKHPTPGGLLWFLDQGSKIQVIEREQKVLDYGLSIPDIKKIKRPSSLGPTNTKQEVVTSNPSMKSAKSSVSRGGTPLDAPKPVKRYTTCMKPFKPNRLLPFDEESGTYLPPQNTLNRAIKRAEDKFVREIFADEILQTNSKKKKRTQQKQQSDLQE